MWYNQGAVSEILEKQHSSFTQQENESSLVEGVGLVYRLERPLGIIAKKAGYKSLLVINSCVHGQSFFSLIQFIMNRESNTTNTKNMCVSG